MPIQSQVPGVTLETVTPGDDKNLLRRFPPWRVYDLP
jgi:hypothetical protein